MQTLKHLIHSKIPNTVRRSVEAFPVSSGLEMPTRSGNSSPMSINSPASILATSLEGTGGRPAPRATVLVGRLSGSPEGGNIFSPISDAYMLECLTCDHICHGES